MIVDWLVNLVAVVVIVFIVWWFWFAKPRSVNVTRSGVIEIRVADGVYTPAYIELPVQQPVTLRFFRDDPNPCAEKVIIDKLGIARQLALHAATDIVLTPEKPGEYPFTCEMQMYRGKLIVR